MKNELTWIIIQLSYLVLLGRLIYVIEYHNYWSIPIVVVAFIILYKVETHLIK